MIEARTDRMSVRAFLYTENPTLGVGFREAYSYEYEKETPFDIINLRPGSLRNYIKRRKVDERQT